MAKTVWRMGLDEEIKERLSGALLTEVKTFGFSSRCKENHGRICTGGRGGGKVRITFFKDDSGCPKETGTKAEAREQSRGDCCL